MSLIVRTMWGPEGEVFLLSCEGTCLEWLVTKFAELARSRGSDKNFQIGDGRPVKAAGAFELHLQRNENENTMNIVSEGRNFIWLMSSRTAERFRELAQALIDSSAPGHQYLERPDPAVPAVLLSKGGYDETLLQSMSMD